MELQALPARQGRQGRNGARWRPERIYDAEQRYGYESEHYRLAGLAGPEH
jgi:hypothetical protein